MNHHKNPNRKAEQGMQSARKPAFWLVSAALLVPLLLTTPLQQALLNPEDVSLNPAVLLAVLALACVVGIVFLTVLLRILAFKRRSLICAIMLALATALALQAYWIHGQFEYGVFNGSPIDWSSYGIWFWLESVLLLVFITVLIFLLKPRPELQQNLALLLLVLALVQPLGNIGKLSELKAAEAQALDFDESVFQFSRNLNVIHLLPDGFQSDLALQVLREDPELTRVFEKERSLLREEQAESIEIDLLLIHLDLRKVCVVGEVECQAGCQ